MMINKYNFRKVLYVFFVGILSISLIGCSDKNSNKNTNSVKKKTNQSIEVSVKELKEIVTNEEEGEKYKNSKIKVKGFYDYYEDSSDGKVTKYIEDNNQDANYMVELEDDGFFYEDHLPGDAIELVGKLNKLKDKTNFKILSAVVNGKKVIKNEKKTIEVTKIKDFLDNKDYYQGTEVTLYGKIILEKDDSNNEKYYLEDVKTKDRLELNTNCDKISFSSLIEKDNPYIILNFTYLEDHDEDDVTYSDDSKNYGYSEVYVWAREKTDRVIIHEKKKENKNYDTVVTPEELYNNFSKYEGKLISLEGYGNTDSNDGFNQNGDSILMEKNFMSTSRVTIYSKNDDPDSMENSSIYKCFLDQHKYLVKGTPKENSNGKIYLVVDQN